jgi:hypothetical protein
MSGAQVYKEVYNKFVDELGHEEANKKASEGAVEAVKLNTAINTVLNFTPVATMFKSSRYLKQAEKLGINRLAGEADDAFVARLKKMKDVTPPGSLMDNTLVKLGVESQQEGLEELVNLFSEEEGRIAGGIKEKGDKSRLGRFFDSALTEEGALSYILGAVGGVTQTGAMESIPMYRDAKLDESGQPIVENGKIQKEWVSASGRQKRERNRNYTQYVTDLTEDMEAIIGYQQDLREAVQKGDAKKIEETKQKMFNITAYNAITNGSAKELIQTFTDIYQLSEAEAKEMGLGEDYKEIAEAKVKQLERLDDKYTEIMTKYNYGDEEALQLGNNVFRIAVAIDSIEEMQRDLNKELNKQEFNLTDVDSYFDARIEYQAAEKALEQKQAELEEIDKLRKSRGGKKSLLKKHGVKTIEEAYQKVEAESERLYKKKEKFEKIYEDAYNDYKNLEENKGKSQEDVDEGFHESFNKNHAAAQSIIQLRANNAMLDEEKLSLNDSYKKITSAEGRKNFVKTAKEELNKIVQKQEEAAKKEENKKKKETNAEARKNSNTKNKKKKTAETKKPTKKKPTTDIQTRINEVVSNIVGSDELFNFEESESNPGTWKNGEFTPDNMGEQIFNAINKTVFQGERTHRNTTETRRSI